MSGASLHEPIAVLRIPKAAAALGSGESSAAAGFDVLAKQREWGDLVPSNADDEITDAEVVDDELLALEERIRADGRQFGLDPARYLIAVRAQCECGRGCPMCVCA